jgi:hypothetical protein
LRSGPRPDPNALATAVYDGEADVDAWLDGVGQAILPRRVRARARVNPPVGRLRARADFHEQTAK